jgi:iron complex outermembrane recepter protein
MTVFKKAQLLPMLLACGVSALSSTAVYADSYNFDVPAGDLKAALDLFIRQTGSQLIYRVDDLRGKETHGAHGNLSSAEALDRLLEGTGFKAVRDSEGSIAISRDGPKSGPRTGGPSTGRTDTSGTGSDVVLDEVVVTATKLQEPARTIAGSVTVITGSQLDEVGAQSFADYLTRTPGVIFNAGIPGESSATIRGVSTTTTVTQGQGTTGYFLNDVPLTDPNFTVSIPDIDTFDVNNVAVLRGPQGTLFGSGSLGGAINYEAALPDPTAFHFRLQGTVAATNSGDGSQSGKAMVNVPILTDMLAVRAVFVYRSDGGYINNIGTGVNNSNRTLIRGGRAEILWTPAENTKINYLYLKQTEDTADSGDEEPVSAGVLAKKTLIPEPIDFTTTINNIRLDQGLGFATLTATATYHQKSQVSDDDATAAFGPLFGNQLSPINIGQAAAANGTTFEVRLASTPGGRFDYLVGGMHDLTRESILDTSGAPGAQQYATTVYDPIFGSGFGQRAVPNNIFLTSTLGAKGEEEALFGEGTFHFNDEWKATLGGRLFDTKLTGSTSTSGLLEYLLTNPNVLDFSYATPESAHGFTPKASVTWTPSADVMVYALASKGFRFGGPNVNPPSSTTPFPPTYAPDTLWNYELGTRTTWLDQRVQWDSTVFYIDWSNIQVRLSTPSGLAYGANAGKATNYGLENSAIWRPISPLSLQANLTYLHATLSEPFQSGTTFEPAGAVLPGASKWNFSSVVRYDLPGLPLHPVIVLSDRFISVAPAGFGFTEPVTQGNYNLLDGRLVTHVRSVEVTLFADNIADRRGVSNANDAAPTPLEQFIVRPRTIGLTVDYSY